MHKFPTLPVKNFIAKGHSKMSFFTDFCEFYKLPQEATKFGLSLLFSFPIGFIVKKIIVKTTSHDDDISNYHDSGSSSNHHHHDNTSSSNPTSHHDHRSGSNLSNATKTTPHLINFILTSLLTIFLFSPISYLLLLLSALTTYTLSWLGISPSINFMIIFIQLLAVQVKMQVYGGMTDFSSIMMVMTIKLTAFAYAYNDRKYINEDSDEDTTKGTSTETTTKSNTKKLDEYQQKHVIKELPPLITYLGYCFNIVGYFVGPGLEFKDYQAWVTSGFGVRVKGLGLRSLKVFVLGVGLMVLHLGLEGRYVKTQSNRIRENYKQNTNTPRYHFSHVTEPWFALLTPFQKYIYITISGVIVRSKFHAAWKVSEAVGLISGLGVRNVDGVVRFDGCEVFR